MTRTKVYTFWVWWSVSWGILNFIVAILNFLRGSYAFMLVSGIAFSMCLWGVIYYSKKLENIQKHVQGNLD